MSTYLEAQVAVYRFLLKRHTTDSSFRFSVRQQNFTGNGIFVGKEFPAGSVKPYFSFTCWQITSGSQGDVLAYLIEATKTGSFTVCLDLHPLPHGNEQDAHNRGLTEAVRARVAGPWKRDTPYGQRHMPAATNVAEVLTALDQLLDLTLQPLNTLVKEVKEAHPDWEGGLIATSKFATITAAVERERSALLCADFESVRREQALKKLPTLWASGLLKAQWEKAQELGELTFATIPKALPKARAGDLVVATDSNSDRRAYGLGRVQADAAGSLLAVEWIVTLPIEFTENTYTTSAFSKSRKLDQTLTGFEQHQPGLLDILLANEPGKKKKQETDSSRENDEAKANSDDADSVQEIVFTAATAHESGVFLTEIEITEIVEALRLKKNIILKGPPGVGKTFVARKLAYVLFNSIDDSRIELTQFHQSVAYEDFVRGWRPGGTHGALTIANGPLVTFAEKARADPARPYVLIIDEINRGNLSKIFGELFMLLEADKREAKYGVRLTYPNPLAPDEKFFLPPNLYLIGTMNTADRSLALVDYALRRRFRFFELRPQLGDALVQHLTGPAYGFAEAEIRLRLAVVEALNEHISDAKKEPLLGPGFAIGHAYFCGPKSPGQTAAAWFAAIVRHELLPLLEEYWDGDPKGGKELKKWRDQLLPVVAVSAAAAVSAADPADLLEPADLTA